MGVVYLKSVTGLAKGNSSAVYCSNRRIIQRPAPLTSLRLTKEGFQATSLTPFGKVFDINEHAHVK